MLRTLPSLRRALVGFLVLLAGLSIPLLARAQNPFLEREGERTIVGISFFGNRVTRDYVLRREMGIAVGDRYDPAAVSDAWERLEQLGFISYVDIQADRPRLDQVHLLVTVEEERRLGFAPYYDYERRYHGSIVGLEATVQNLRGRAETLRLTTAWGALHGYQLHWDNPRILDPARLGVFVEGYWRRYDFRFLPLRLAETGARGGIFRDFPLRLRATLALEWRQLKVDRSELPRTDGTTDDPVLELRLQHDSRDLTWYPRRGVLAAVEARLAGLGQDEPYQTGTGLVAAWETLPWVGILGGRTRLLLASERLPFWERSYLGGPMDLRGIDFGGVRGDESFLATLELRRPIFLVPLREGRSVGVGVHAFHDWGKAWEKGAGQSSAPLHRSWGAGVHFNLNTKSLRLEWARTDEGDDVFVIEDRLTF